MTFEKWKCKVFWGSFTLYKSTLIWRRGDTVCRRILVVKFKRQWMSLLPYKGLNDLWSSNTTPPRQNLTNNFCWRHCSEYCSSVLLWVVLLHSKCVAPINGIVTQSSNGYFVNITEAKRIHCYHYRGINKLSVTLLP